MPRFRMQTLLQFGFFVGISTSLVYFYFLYSLPAEDDNIKIEVRSAKDNVVKQSGINDAQYPDEPGLPDSLKVLEPTGKSIEKEQPSIHSHNDQLNIPKNTLRFEEAEKTDQEKSLPIEKQAEQSPERNSNVRKPEKGPEVRNVDDKRPVKNPDQEEVIEEVIEYSDGSQNKHIGEEVVQKGNEMPIGQKEKHDMEENEAEDSLNKNGGQERQTQKMKQDETHAKTVNEQVKDSHDIEEKKEQAKVQVNGEAVGIMDNDKKPSEREWMHLAVVACGERVSDTLAMVKSACIVSTKKIHVHIFADDDNRPTFQKELSSWKRVKDGKLGFSIYPITYPHGNANEWIKLFRPCATQRLFLPAVLPDVELLLYVDTDILFLQSMDAIWRFFDDFNSTHIAALAPEHEDPHVGWYNRFARHPYYPPLGVNSGVMLMNLSRMREVKFVDKMTPYFKQYKYSITWGDQDLINIYFHFFPEKLLVYPCQWNYRPDHCMYMSVCRTAEQYGAQVLHGCREVFKNEKQPAFKAVYQAFQSHNMEQDIGSLVNSMKENFAKVKDTNCGRVQHIFTKVLEEMARR